MSVRLVSYTKPADEFQDLSDSNLLDLVAYSARVSNPKNQMNKETNEKLVKYLIDNKHWSPLECVSICLEITVQRDIARQILRHRSFSFQEFSQRYANPAEMDSMFATREARFQDTKNRQNSIDIDKDDSIHSEWEQKQQEVIRLSEETYKWAIDNGIAKEQARVVLPEGLVMSRLYMQGNLRSWVHYIELRTANGTQKEHMEIAEKCATEIAKIFPMITNI